MLSPEIRIVRCVPHTNQSIFDFNVKDVNTVIQYGEHKITHSRVLSLPTHMELFILKYEFLFVLYTYYEYLI